MQETITNNSKRSQQTQPDKYKVVLRNMKATNNKAEPKEDYKNMVVPFLDRVSWSSAQDFFQNNGTEPPLSRAPSPDKITTPHGR